MKKRSIYIYTESNLGILMNDWVKRTADWDKQKKEPFARMTLFIKVCKSVCVKKVVPPGIEPGTQGFSVLCSTN